MYEVNILREYVHIDVYVTQTTHLEPAPAEHVLHDGLHVALAHQKIHVRLGLLGVAAQVGQAVRSRGGCSKKKTGVVVADGDEGS